MTVEGMRDRICNVYNSDKWRRRVALMPERQVVAIYKNMERHNRLVKKKPIKPYYKQISMFDDPNFVMPKGE